MNDPALGTRLRLQGEPFGLRDESLAAAKLELRATPAPRVLARAYFEETFIITQNGYRMLVRVLEVGEDSMVYQRMSAQRELAGRARSCPMIVFLANFMPEAAAY